MWVPVLRLPRGARLVPARLNPARLARSADLSGGVRQQKGMTRTLPCKDATASAALIPFFFLLPHKKKDASRSRKEVAHGHESKGFTLHLVSCLFLKKIEPLRDLGKGLRARTRCARGPRFEVRRSLTSSESASLTQRALTRTP